jgi:hypothetical protein
VSRVAFAERPAARTSHDRSAEASRYGVLKTALKARATAVGQARSAIAF